MVSTEEGVVVEELGRFADSSPYRGQAIDYSSGTFSIRGSGDVDVRLLVQMDERGEVVWRDRPTRDWVRKQAAALIRSQQATAQTAGPAHVPASSGSRPPRSPWVVVGVVVFALALVGGCIGVIALLQPEIIVHNGGNNNENQFTQTCAIELVSAWTPTDYMGTFVARTPDGQEVTSGGYFVMTATEYSNSTLEYNDERARAVQGIADRLQNDGWTQTGRGETWYSLEFGR